MDDTRFVTKLEEWLLLLRVSQSHRVGSSVRRPFPVSVLGSDCQTQVYGVRIGEETFLLPVQGTTTEE